MSTLELIEPFAEEISEMLIGETLAAIRQKVETLPRHTAEFHDATKRLFHLFAVANAVRYYKMHINPERWLGNTEVIVDAKRILGIAVTLEEQKKELTKRGYLK